ncbi:hypothetical protein DENSPDRAFT_883389 [Dentipellis sp. KUC8613]|nr:hypothetical protein DENSPDRAFT_883389 [Dentipellis sp. KUC8613]
MHRAMLARLALPLHTRMPPSRAPTVPSCAPTHSDFAPARCRDAHPRRRLAPFARPRTASTCPHDAVIPAPTPHHALLPRRHAPQQRRRAPAAPLPAVAHPRSSLAPPPPILARCLALPRALPRRSRTPVAHHRDAVMRRRPPHSPPPALAPLPRAPCRCRPPVTGPHLTRPYRHFASCHVASPRSCAAPRRLYPCAAVSRPIAPSRAPLRALATLWCAVAPSCPLDLLITASRRATSPRRTLVPHVAMLRVVVPCCAAPHHLDCPVARPRHALAPHHALETP